MVRQDRLRQREDERRDAILQVRASLGTWTSANMSIVITERGVTPQEDLRGYKVVESRGSYQKPFTYNITLRDVYAKIKTLQQSGYKLSQPQFPELQEFFRNGNPITAMDIFEDAVNEIETETDNRTGIEFLLDNWN